MEERLMRTTALAIALLSTVLTGGCADDEQWIAPATPVFVPPETWKARVTLTSVTGPETCFDGRDSVGSNWRELVYVRREANTITMVYGPESHDLELMGSADGDTFTVSGGWLSDRVCDGVTMDYAYEMQVSGRFSEDGLMTATATETYTLGGDGAVVQTLDWVAERELPQ
jgi:hypothetical protein